MLKKILIGIFVLSSLSTYFVIRYGLRPKSISIIRPSEFETPEKLALYIYRQMYQVLGESAVIAFGTDSASIYQKAVVQALIKMLDDDAKEKGRLTKVYFQISIHDAYHKYPESLIHELERQKKTVIPSLIFEDLKDVQKISQLRDCSQDLHFQVWIECLKENKLRQMYIAKKINLKKTIAVFDRVSESDWVSFLKF